MKTVLQYVNIKKALEKIMKEETKKVYIGVAWPYVNGLFHIGHLSGSYLPADIFSRFHQLEGREVLMISGSDCHGTPITLKAKEEDKTPEEVADKFHKLNKKYLNEFRIEYSLYTSTRTKNHKDFVQKFFLELLKNSFIKKKKTRQLYSEKSETFLQDRYVEGVCPFCGSEQARGDQCEKCGRSLDPLELKNPVSKIDQSELVKKETENYFIDLPICEDEIKEWLQSKENMKDWIKKESLGWIKEGLKPRAITRDLDYGIDLPVSEIPEEKRIEDIENKVFYVWFEAVIGYISGSIEYSEEKGAPDYWKDFFYGDTPSFYFVGQDNLVFHTINWPTQLLGYDEDINLPENVFVNKFVNLEGKKISKSRNWLIETDYLVENYSPEAVRFYLAFNFPEQKQFNFTWKDFIETNNSVLVGTLGNFIHRVLTFSYKNFGKDFKIEKEDLSSEVKEEIEGTFEQTSNWIKQGKLKKSLRKIVELASFGNKFLEEKAPWKSLKEDKEETKKVLVNSLAIVESLRKLVFPFIPSSSEKLSEFLGMDKDITEIEVNNWKLENKEIKLDSNISPLFSKIDEDKIEEEKNKLKK